MPSSFEIALEQGARLVAVNCRQSAATRNAGARAAAGDPLIFIDADAVANARVLRAALRCLLGGAAGGGCVIRIDGRLPPYARVLGGLLSLLQPVIGLPGGCFLFCTRRAYLAVAGFDETLYAAEEVVFTRRLKRLGRFVILRGSVTTSGRKLRAHAGLGLLRFAARNRCGGAKG